MIVVSPVKSFGEAGAVPQSGHESALDSDRGFGQGQILLMAGREEDDGCHASGAESLAAC